MIRRTAPKISGAAISNLGKISREKLRLPATAAQHRVRVIGIQPDQIVTDHLTATLTAVDGQLVSDVDNDVLKIAVIERYSGKGGHSIGFVRGFGLQHGALAASVAHDAHNIIVVGCDDDSMVAAVNLIIKRDGGITVNDGQGRAEIIELPIGGFDVQLSTRSSCGKNWWVETTCPRLWLWAQRAVFAAFVPCLASDSRVEDHRPRHYRCRKFFPCATVCLSLADANI